jgi:hypothetical protein
MRIPQTVAAAVACLVIGTAAYLSRAVLDRVMVGDQWVRVALLPAWPAWIGFVLVAALGMWWLSHRDARPGRSPDVPRQRSIARLLLPSFALLAIVVPYLPWIPDWLPGLQTLAGPGRAIVWLAVGMQVGWALWQESPRVLPWLERLSMGRLAAFVAVCTIAVSALAAVRLIGTVFFPTGDEPHYLVMAQSLWRDGDLAIENNHGRGDYREYFLGTLEPHFVTRGVDGEIYSIHPVGLPVLIAPVYALGGYRFVVTVLIAMAGLAAAVMWRWVVLAINSAAGATFAWAAIVGSAPFLLNTFAVYPEIAAALAAVLAFTMSLALERDSRPTRAAIVGLAAAALPWLSTKYAPMSATLVAVALGRVWIPWPATRRPASSPAPFSTSAAIIVPYVLSLAVWFGFFYAYWGIALPQAPYGALVQTDLKNLVFGAPGLFFDQEYGLLAYAPVYILAVTGLAVMWREGNEHKRHAVEIALVFGVLVGTVGAFRIWWGGTASPGRPLVAGLLLLGLPIAAAFRAAGAGSPRRAAQHLLLWVSVGVTATLVVAREGMLINNGRDGSSTLLEYWSPLWSAWTLAPSFIHHEAGTALLHSLAWLSVGTAAALLLRRMRTRTPGAAALSALTTMAAALVTVALVIPLLPSDPPHPQLDLRARARIAALESFDRSARPIAVLYDPIRATAASDVVPMLVLRVQPGWRQDSQPVRLLHNGRFSLPAGRYRVDIQWSPRDPLPVSGQQSFELQVGRLGPALEGWSLAATSGGHAQAEFSLPVDASFVGFRGSPDVERSVAAIAVIPLEVVDEGLRTRTPPVLAASRYDDATVLFHVDGIFPEPSGFWTLAGRETSVTLARASPPDAPTVVRLHPGPRPNHVVLSTYGWRDEHDLVPGTHTNILLPDPRRRIVPLAIDTASGFVPFEYDPTSRDRRVLGAWVEVGR